MPSAIQRAVGSSSGSPARNSASSDDRSCFVRCDGSCFFSTRIAVGAVNITLTRCFATMRHQMPGSGSPSIPRVGRPFVQHGRHPAQQRRVDDVAVADDPADVARGEDRATAGHRVHRAVDAGRIEDVLDRRRERDRVAAGVALHALRRAGRAARVEDVARLVRLEPDVHGTRSSRWRSISVAQSRSRPSTSVIGASPRSSSTTASGRCVASRSASSSSGLYAMTLPAREPASADRITFGVASSMRAARLADAKPPKTTEWIAPIRVHASIANSASGTIGMYSSTRSPRPTPSATSIAADAIDLVVQLAIRVDALVPGLGRDVDQRGLVGARREMPVDRVVADVRRAADEPAQQRRARRVEHPIERRVPVDRRGLGGPEAFRVVDAAAIDVVVERHRRVSLAASDEDTDETALPDDGGRRAKRAADGRASRDDAAVRADPPTADPAVP